MQLQNRRTATRDSAHPLNSRQTNAAIAANRHVTFHRSPTLSSLSQIPSPAPPIASRSVNAWLPSLRCKITIQTTTTFSEPTSSMSTSISQRPVGVGSLFFLKMFMTQQAILHALCIFWNVSIYSSMTKQCHVSVCLVRRLDVIMDEITRNISFLPSCA